MYSSQRDGQSLVREQGKSGKTDLAPDVKYLLFSSQEH